MNGGNMYGLQKGTLSPKPLLNAIEESRRSFGVGLRRGGSSVSPPVPRVIRRAVDRTHICIALQLGPPPHSHRRSHLLILVTISLSN
jgi:hypothetical protein